MDEGDGHDWGGVVDGDNKGDDEKGDDDDGDKEDDNEEDEGNALFALPSLGAGGGDGRESGDDHRGKGMNRAGNEEIGIDDMWEQQRMEMGGGCY